MRKRDHVIRARSTLMARDTATSEALDGLDADIAAEMDAAIDFAVSAAAPDLSSLFRDVYGPMEPEPEPLRTRLDRVLARA